MKHDLHRYKSIHLLGIGGCGMSGIAKILHEMDFKVSGSDAKEGPNTVRLKDLGVKVFIGHDASLVRDVDLIVYSSAVTKTNPEMMEAEAKGIKIIKRAEALAWIMEQSTNRIAIAGTHGKTTTTAMISKVFDAGKQDPTFLIGCDMDYSEGNAKKGNGVYSVAEADESDSSFLLLSPTLEVITNIEADHMEHFGSMRTLLSTFEKFMERLSTDGTIVIEGSDPNNKKLMNKVKRNYITYGFDPSMEFSAKNMTYDTYFSHYMLMHKDKELGKVELSVPGWQNVVNSLAVFAVALQYGLDFSTIAGALHTFIGARRRFSTVGEYGGILVIDDYAHHPTEVSATLSAARAGWPSNRIICVFQPHRYSRTMLLKDRFAKAFEAADLLVLTDIYAASEAPIPGISGKTIADIVTNENSRYIPKKEQIPELLIKELKEGDIVLTLGAGDIHTVGKEILARLKMKDAKE